ncbi:hypothetical protein [Leucobacter sp. wl10]|uniref:hypothetical protein n=1 Tax=Leucobacter sp. wl10 TaxID=2304677 RepID=UPI000E5A2249|nr:hypothetical protein [Leucobacter sp. wl10]RGE18551.1 hypothetical protein D1J51_14770 [Leucobacter sp. wl10]
MTTSASGPGRAAATAIVTATAVAGGLALLAIGISTTAEALAPEASENYEYGGGVGTASSGADYELYEPNLEGLESIRVDAAATSFTLALGDVEEAALSVRQNGYDGQWSMYREDGALVISQPQLPSVGGCLFSCGRNGSGDVTLTLPRSLGESGRLSADLSIAAGALQGEGRFDALGLEMQAGSVRFVGAARSLDLKTQLGKAKVELADVEEAALDVQTGDATVTFTGDPPRSIEAVAEMAGLTAQLPEAEYRVDLRDALGEVDNGLVENQGSDRKVRVRSTAADVVLR